MPRTPLSRSGELRTSVLRRTLAGLLSTAALAVGLTSVEASAQVPNGPVGLKRVGPVDPYLGFPYWYEDTTGLKLGLCKDPGMCFFGADPLRPVTFPQTVEQAVAGDFNFPDEAFYYAIENLEIAPLPARARVLYHVAIEAAFASGDVMPGQQVVFARLRIRLRDMVPEATYTIRHPYGEEVLVTEADGSVFYTRDLGLMVGNFEGALYGDIGPFLVPVGFDRAAPKGTFLSDGGLTLERLEGSPIGRNFCEYEGPGLGALFPALAVDGSPTLIRSETFSLQGRIAEQYGVGIDEAYYSASGDASNGTLATTVTAFAQSASGESLLARVGEGTWTPMEETGTTGHYFVQLDQGNANTALPSSLEVRNVSDTPISIATKASIPDLVTVHSATYTLGTTTTGGSLEVQLTSTDRSASRLVDVDLADFEILDVPTGGLGDAAIQRPLPATYVPPSSIVVRSSAGGVAEVPLEILGAGRSVEELQGPGPVADAGLDSSVEIRSVITLTGAFSTPPESIVQYLWAPPAVGFAIDSALSNGAILVGQVLQAGDLTFSLTVIDQYGRAATDTVVVHVTDPNVVVDTISVLAARYETGRGRWDVSGTSSVQWDQRVDVYLALLDATGQTVLVDGQPVKDPARRVGTAFVADLGAWRYRGTTSVARPEAIPTANDRFVVAESALQGKASLAIRISR